MLSIMFTGGIFRPWGVWILQPFCWKTTTHPVHTDTCAPSILKATLIEFPTVNSECPPPSLMTFSSGFFISPDTSLQLTFPECSEVAATSALMTDRDGSYSNYWQKQRSPNLQSHANDLIIYFRTASDTRNIRLGDKRGETEGGEGGGDGPGRRQETRMFTDIEINKGRDVAKCHCC